MQTPYYYRGTTRGWPGNRVLSENKITCVSTDPIVATLFAIECRNHGAAAIIIAATAKFPTALAENHFAIMENAVNLAVSPQEFEDQASLIVDVDSAIIALRDLGFDEIPARLANLGHLREEVRAYSNQRKLTLRLIREFDRKIGLEG